MGENHFTDFFFVCVFFRGETTRIPQAWSQDEAPEHGMMGIPRLLQIPNHVATALCYCFR